jgi:predicted permease
MNVSQSILPVAVEGGGRGLRDKSGKQRRQVKHSATLSASGHSVASPLLLFTKLRHSPQQKELLLLPTFLFYCFKTPFPIFVLRNKIRMVTFEMFTSVKVYCAVFWVLHRVQD